MANVVNRSFRRLESFLLDVVVPVGGHLHVIPIPINTDLWVVMVVQAPYSIKQFLAVGVWETRTCLECGPVMLVYLWHPSPR